MSRTKYLFECRDCGKITDNTLGVNGSCPERAHVASTHRYEVVA